MIRYSLVCTLLLFVIPSPVVPKKMSVVWNERLNSYGLVKGEANNYISAAEYNNDVNKTGWATLEIHTNANHSDIDQAYSAGLIEALITSDLIKLSWLNSFDGYCGKPLSAYCQKLKNYVDANAAWMQQQIDSFADTDPYWHQVRLFLIQMQGLIDGYGFHQEKRQNLYKFIYKPDITGLLLIQMSGDLDELQTIFNGGQKLRDLGTGHCSALIKLLPGNTDLYTSQVTWNTYGSMLRILKRYHFGYHLTPGSNKLVPGNDVTFSSYPGLLLSGDDFYVLSSGLVTQETTIGNNNDSLWQFIKPVGSVFESIRNVVANRLASTGAEWTQLFSKFNSGTYNNQWMIVNYNQFVAGEKSLKDGLLWVLEQLPVSPSTVLVSGFPMVTLDVPRGMVMSRDVTDVLRNQSYWPSYNIPYFREVFDASGWPPLVAKYGNWFSYDQSPRANIFRRDHRNVLDSDSMMKLMRYNDYTHDPMSACNCTPPYSAENAISARCDLNPANGTYPFGALGHRSHGATDMKMTSSDMMKLLQFIAISGPTHDPLTPFQWSKSDFEKTVAHFGHPDLWLFEPVLHEWSMA